MAKASFHKGQRVFVKPVGTWAEIEKVLPHWVKGVEEPLRIHYDVGLGREFAGHELFAETAPGRQRADDDYENWRVLRLRGHWEFEGDLANARHRGTFPVIVTDEMDWGGWRVPKAEYDRDPEKIEHQARVMVNAQRMMRVCRDLVARAEESETELDADVKDLVERANAILRDIHLDPDSETMAIAAE